MHDAMTKIGVLVYYKTTMKYKVKDFSITLLFYSLPKIGESFVVLGHRWKVALVHVGGAVAGILDPQACALLKIV